MAPVSRSGPGTLNAGSRYLFSAFWVPDPLLLLLLFDYTWGYHPHPEGLPPLASLGKLRNHSSSSSSSSSFSFATCFSRSFSKRKREREKERERERERERKKEGEKERKKEREREREREILRSFYSFLCIFISSERRRRK